MNCHRRRVTEVSVPLGVYARASAACPPPGSRNAPGAGGRGLTAERMTGSPRPGGETALRGTLPRRLRGLMSAEVPRLGLTRPRHQDLPPADEAHRRGVSAANSRKPRDDPNRPPEGAHSGTSAAVRGHVCAATRPRGQFGRHSCRGRTGAGVRRAVWPWRVGPALGRHADPARRVLPAGSARHGLTRQMVQRPVFVSAHQPVRANE